jgi:hypothetical protein
MQVNLVLKSLKQILKNKHKHQIESRRLATMRRYLLLNGSDCINFVKLLHLMSFCSRDRNYCEILIYWI